MRRRGTTLGAGGVKELCGRPPSSRWMAAASATVAIVVVGNGSNVRAGMGEFGRWEMGMHCWRRGGQVVSFLMQCGGRWC